MDGMKTKNVNGKNMARIKRVIKQQPMKYRRFVRLHPECSLIWEIHDRTSQQNNLCPLLGT